MVPLHHVDSNRDSDLESISDSDAKRLKELVDEHEFNWQMIASVWKEGKYPPLECREIYLSLPSQTTLSGNVIQGQQTLFIHGQY